MQVVLERNTRNKKKCITTISGLESFGVKLQEAAKLFGKKFASGASITKNAESKEQIDCQVGNGSGTGAPTKAAVGTTQPPLPAYLLLLPMPWALARLETNKLPACPRAGRFPGPGRGPDPEDLQGGQQSINNGD